MDPVCVPYVKRAAAAHLWLGLLLGGLVMGALAAAVFAALPRRVTLVLHDAVHYTAMLKPQSHAVRAAVRLAPSVDTLAGGYVMVPAVYSEVDEGFVIRMRLGLDNVIVVLDSGSANLSVGTADCVKDRLCSAHDGAYRPGTSAHAVNLGTAAKLSYASLDVEAHWWQDSAALPVVAAAACAHAPPPLEAVTSEVSLATLLPVAAARRMTGTVSNVAGLMTLADGGGGGGGGDDQLPFIEHVWSALGVPRRWGLACGKNGSGWLVLGTFPRACFPALKLAAVPMSRQFSYNGAPCIDIVAMRYGVKDAHGKVTAWRTFDAHPAHALVDTGTAETYVTAPFAAAFAAAGLPSRAASVPDRAVDALPDVAVELAGGVRVVYTPRQYMVRAAERTYRSTLHVGDEKMAGLFGTAPVLLLGIHHLTGLYVDVDAVARTVAFGHLP